MSGMVKRTLCLMLALICVGGSTAMSEQAYYSGSAEESWYADMLAQGQMSLGNNLRLKRVIERAQAGEEITVALIGGSITEGAGAAKYEECYAYRFAQGFAQRYGVNGGANVRFINAGVGGTPSTFGLMRYERDVVRRVQDADSLPDLVVVEFAVNDYGEPTQHHCYESLVKKILSQPNDPAVILLFSVFQGGFNLQDQLKIVGKRYDLMMVSIKDAAYPHVGQEWTQEQFFFDQYHPTSLGHGVMADCLLAAVASAARMEPCAQDIDMTVSPAYGTDFTGLKTIFADGDNSGIQLDRGGFAHDDLRSYANRPVGRVCGPNFCHYETDAAQPLRFTAVFRNLLIAWRAWNSVNESNYGPAVILVDGQVVCTLTGAPDKWGQSEVVLAFNARESLEHTVEIRMAEGAENKRFTVTCIGYTP